MTRDEGDPQIEDGWEGSLFERYRLDPKGGVGAITERLQELIEETEDEKIRRQLRRAWEELTLHPRRRLRQALKTHPIHSTSSSTAALPAAPRPDRLHPPTLFDLTLRSSLASVLRLGGEIRQETPTPNLVWDRALDEQTPDPKG